VSLASVGTRSIDQHEAGLWRVNGELLRMTRRSTPGGAGQGAGAQERQDEPARGVSRARKEAIQEMVALRAQGRPLRAIADAVKAKGVANILRSRSAS
jgi:hypothetical protein